jgi:hypothetical protein
MSKFEGVVINEEHIRLTLHIGVGSGMLAGLLLVSPILPGT